MITNNKIGTLSFTTTNRKAHGREAIDCFIKP